MTVAVRTGEERDLPVLTDIYNHYVTATTVTFDDVPLTLAQRRDWLARYAPTGPHMLLVAQDGTELIGYATSSPFRAKPGYRTSVETTVYVAPRAVGRGVGTTLYTELLGQLADVGLHRAYAGWPCPTRPRGLCMCGAGSRQWGRTTRWGASSDAGSTSNGSSARCDRVPAWRVLAPRRPVCRRAPVASPA